MIETHFALLSYPRHVNLGDAIQSLAAKQFLPRVDIRIPRERLSLQPAGGRKVKLILNGWFMHHPEYWPPHPDIEPLPISMHFAAHDFGRFQRWRKRPLDRLLSGEGAEYLRKWAPIGARDQSTADELSHREIPNYLSGCLTLTLRPKHSVPREDLIVTCDLSRAQLAQLRRQTTRPIITVSHQTKPSNDDLSFEQAAEELLLLYSRAAAVVTTRVHAALPCLALETPVLLLHRPNPDRRVGGAMELCRACDFNAFSAGRHGFDFDSPTPNPDRFRPFADELRRACLEFVKSP